MVNRSVRIGMVQVWLALRIRVLQTAIHCKAGPRVAVADPSRRAIGQGITDECHQGVFETPTVLGRELSPFLGQFLQCRGCHTQFGTAVSVRRIQQQRRSRQIEMFHDTSLAPVTRNPNQVGGDNHQPCATGILQCQRLGMQFGCRPFGRLFATPEAGQHHRPGRSDDSHCHTSAPTTRILTRSPFRRDEYSRTKYCDGPENRQLASHGEHPGSDEIRSDG